MAPPKKVRAPAAASNKASRDVLKKRGIKVDGDSSSKAVQKKRSKALWATPDDTGVKVGKDVVAEVLRKTPIKPAQLPEGFAEAQVLKALHDSIVDLDDEFVTTSKLLGRFWERLLPLVKDVQRDAHLTMEESLDMLHWALTEKIQVVGESKLTPLEVRLMNATGGFTRLNSDQRAEMAAAAGVLSRVESLLPIMFGKKLPNLSEADAKALKGVKLTYADSWKIDGKQFKDAAVLLEVGPFKVLVMTLEAKTRYSEGGAAQAQTFIVRLAAAGSDAKLSYFADGKSVPIELDPKNLLINHMWLSSNLVVKEAGQAGSTLEMPRPSSRRLRKRIKSQVDMIGDPEVMQIIDIKDLVVPTYKSNIKITLRGMREVCYAIVEAARRKEKARTRSK